MVGPPSSDAISAEAAQRAGPTKPIERAPREPPDGGWAWVVLAAACLSQLFVFGFYGAAAVYVPVWMEFFDSLAAETSLIVSLSSFSMGFLSVAAGVLITRFGVRAVWMTGGVLTSAGLLISALATSPLYLVFSMTLVTALGFSMCVNSGLVALGLYFKKRLNFAVGVASAGFGAGQLVLTPLFEYLIEEYGWRGSVVIVAGLLMHMVAAGALVRPISSRAHKRSRENRQGTVDEIACSNSVGVGKDVNSERRRTDTYEETQATTSDDSSNTPCTVPGLGDDLGTVCLDKEVLSGNADDGDAKEVPTRIRMMSPGVAEKFPAAPALNADNATCVHTANMTQQLQDTIANGTSCIEVLETISLEEQGQPPTTQAKDNSRFINQWKLRVSGLKSFMLEKYGLSGLFRNSSFVLTLPIGIAHGFGWASVVFHLDARAKSIGLQPTEGAIIVSAMGGGAVITSLSHGWFVDKGYISLEQAYILAVLCGNALTSFVMPVLVTFGAVTAVSVLFGMATGIAQPVILVLLQVIVRPSEVAGATSLFLVSWGLGEIIGATLTGWIYDTFDSYDSAYYMSGSAFVIVAILTCAIYILQKRKKSRKEAVVYDIDGVNSETERGTDNKAEPHLETSTAESKSEIGILNPAYTADSNEQVIEDNTTVQTSINRTAKGLAEIDEKHESFC